MSLCLGLLLPRNIFFYSFSYSEICPFKVVLKWLHWFLKQFFIKKRYTGPCSVTVVRSATNWEVTGSNPVVDVDRCCLSPNGFEGASLLNFLLEKIVPGPCGATVTRSACNREIAGSNPVTVKLHLFWLIHPQTELSILKKKKLIMP